MVILDMETNNIKKHTHEKMINLDNICKLKHSGIRTDIIRSKMSDIEEIMYNKRLLLVQNFHWLSPNTRTYSIVSISK